MIRIAHLYYDLMNLYGDNGNIKALKHELENQEVKVKITFLTIGDQINFDDYDLFYIGPGTENNQNLILKDLLKYQKEIKKAIENNKFFLITGNALDIFGKYILTENNKKIKTLKTFDYYIKKEEFRLVDEAVAKCGFLNNYILGFQNQNSTMHELSIPLFSIIKGIGAHPNSKYEGIIYNNFIGTYLIGPLLVRNPDLLKLITQKLITSKNKNFKFRKFNLKLETKAHSEYINNYYNEL